MSYKLPSNKHPLYESAG